jgi:hypothetical protein
MYLNKAHITEMDEWIHAHMYNYRVLHVLTSAELLVLNLQGDPFEYE